MIAHAALKTFLNNHFIEDPQPHTTADKWKMQMWKTEDFVHFTLLKNGRVHHLYPEKHYECMQLVDYKARYPDHALVATFLAKRQPAQGISAELQERKWDRRENCLAFCLDHLGIEYDDVVIDLDTWFNMDPEFWKAYVMLEVVTASVFALGKKLGN